MKDRFYLACFRDNVGSNVAFHGSGGRGYSTDLDKADTYTLEQAQRAWEMGREYDQPISAEHIDALAVWKVDMQYIPSETVINDSVRFWVAFQKGCYDGNDVYWLTDKLPSTDFTKAKRFHLNEVSLSDTDIVYVPMYVAQDQKRRTFDYSKLNKRKMIQGAGLKIPERIKRERRRKNNPKIRMNCPSCGKIHWQYNPYDFEGCNDALCKGGE